MGFVSVGIALALFVGLVMSHSAWFWRAIVFLPVANAALGFLQATRQTCVARAFEGTVEHDDFSKAKADEAAAAASRAVASGIQRDALLWGFGAAAVAVASVAVLR